MARVILVDDHPDVSTILSQMLQACGHAVECCATAEDALRALQRERPDAIIVDQRLPGISGVELVQRLRMDASMQKVWLVICSADDAVREAALAAGAQDFWLKGSARLFDAIDGLSEALNRSDSSD